MRTPRRFSLFILALAWLALPLSIQAGAVLTGTVGADSRDHFKGGHFAYSATLYAKIDDMTLLGVQSGMGALSGSDAIPILATAMIRLPLGRVVLPVATGDVGYVIDDVHGGLLWRGGGGFDIRNGRHSSFLILGAYEGQDSMAGWSARAGLLLEF
ncbi:MAG: hypothetical protein ABI036_07975 [Fibrobacteria bacterium]